MDIDIVIEIDKIPPYDKAPFDPYQDTISVSEDTYSKVIDYCKIGHIRSSRHEYSRAYTYHRRMGRRRKRRDI